MSYLIYSKPDGGVAVVIPASGVATGALAAKTVPDGAEYQLVTRDFVFPVDRIFRNAWTWAGFNQPILEDLEKSKMIASAAVKTSTLEAAKKAADAAFFNEPAALSEEEIKGACSDCMADINAAEDPYEVKLLMCAFCGLPEPELPRDEKLRIRAEEAKAKIKAKLQEIAAAVKSWYDTKVPTVGTMPTPIS